VAIRSVPPLSCNYGHPTGPQNVNPRTAIGDCESKIWIFKNFLKKLKFGLLRFSRLGDSQKLM